MRSLRRLFLIVTLVAAGLGAGVAHARERTFAPDAHGQISFAMPSGNIGCVYTPRGGTDIYQPANGGPELSCDRIAPSYVNVRLGPEGPALLDEHPGEQGCCGADNILAYGDTLRLPGFICSSSTGGLTCETPDRRHGFCVARSRMLHY